MTPEGSLGPPARRSSTNGTERRRGRNPQGNGRFCHGFAPASCNNAPHHNVRREPKSNRVVWRHDRHRRALRYAEPAADQSGARTAMSLSWWLLALGLAVAAVGLAMISREMAEPFVLAILGAPRRGRRVLPVRRRRRHPAFRPDAMRATTSPRPSSTIFRKARSSPTRAGRVLYANESYRTCSGSSRNARVPAPDRAFAGNTLLAEQIFRLSRAAQQGRA